MCQTPGVASGHCLPSPPETAGCGSSSSLERDGCGNWIIRGSDRNDSIHVSQASLHGDPYLKVSINQDVYWVPMTGIRAARSLSLYAGAGNDSVVVDPDVTFPLFIDGGEGDDFLQGGNGPNALLGGCGNDTLIGGSSDDLLLCGSGRDTIVTNGGRDIQSLSDLYGRLLEGRCVPQKAVPQQTPVLAPPPTPCAPPTPLPVKPPPLRRSLPERIRWLSPPRRPRLSDLLASVETHKEKGFKSGRDMTKSLLTALYESPQKFHDVLGSIQGAKEKDDAVASFARALLEAGPDGGRLLRDIPAADKKTMAQYLSVGNCWNANKKGILVLLSQMTGVTDHGFGSDAGAMDYVRRYQGVMS